MNRISRTWIEIDKDALTDNFNNIRAIISDKTKLLCIIKADAYGHGAIECAKLYSSLGADFFGVATAEEAIHLRSHGIKNDLLVLGSIEKSWIYDIVNQDITASVFDYEFAKALSKEAKKQNKTAKIHIKIDTGMTRIGYTVSKENADEILKISNLDNIYIEGIFSHFSKADEPDKNYSKLQFELFMEMDSMLKENGLFIPIRHIANSAAIVDMPEYQLEMVRAGICLYGYFPSPDVDKSKLSLFPAMKIKAHITRIATVKKGTKVSYGGTYITKKDCEKIATVPIGYADGYTRLFSGKTKMMVCSTLVPVVGRICMDQCMIDVTSVNNINVGDEVLIMGKEGDNCIDASYLADIAGTINYEILCMAGKRLTRIYKRNGKTEAVLNYLENW